MTELAVGIDLGTTESCVGIMQNGRVDIIANDQGNRTTPSYVAFTNTERLIGDSAKNQVTTNPLNTIFGAKRLIGKYFNDESVQNDLKYLPFRVTASASGRPQIVVMHQGEDMIFSPEEISSFVLMKMKETAESYLGRSVNRAVITVPAYFNDSQRQATKDAGRIAGLDVIRIINEPTAAALAYGLNKNAEAHNIVVVDIGGGTSDISILTIDSGVFEVKATAGCDHLGGEDFDTRLMEYFMNEFKRKYDKDITQNQRALRRLRSASERAKRTLSTSTLTSVEVDSLFEGIDLYSSITRARFEEICMDLFLKCIQPLEQVLLDAKMRKTDINEIVMVGGSTRIIKIRQLVSDFFEGKELNFNVNPDEAIAYGAAVQAAILSGINVTTHNGSDSVLLLDVTSLSLGIETSGRVMTVMIHRGTTIPTRMEQVFSTNINNQSSATIRVYQGERGLTKDCCKLGEFTITGIRPAPRGIPKLRVCYDVNADGILTVTAFEEGNEGCEKKTVRIERSTLSDDDIVKMIKDAQMYQQQDSECRAKIEARNNYEGMLYPDMSQVPDSKKREVEELLRGHREWLKTDINASVDEYNSRINEIQNILII